MSSTSPHPAGSTPNGYLADEKSPLFTNPFSSYSSRPYGEKSIVTPGSVESEEGLYRASRERHQKRWLWAGTCLAAVFLVFITWNGGSPRWPSSSSSNGPTTTPESGVGDKGNTFDFTDQVRFDKYSLFLKGQRIFLHSGEFHTFRLPVPSLWPDILEKFKAAGLNSVSVYTHMGLINPAPGVVDFDGFRALQPLYDAAKAAGIWIVLRPGPYINAETSAGGIAHWATSEIAGNLRTNDTDWSAAWRAYIRGIIDVTAPNQITKRGPVIAVQIDNEYTQTPDSHAQYFVQLMDEYHNSDIIVPLTYNDPGPRRNFINGTGAVDLYGMDAYPQGFDCSNPTVWRPVDTTYYQYHMEVNPSQAWYIPEFQGGSFDAWGPTAPGYAPCRTLTGPDFQSVFNLHLWASNAKLINYYMLYGGTSWGAIPYPGVYTSYDYGSPITESRELTTKYDELKRQGFFIRSSPDFYKTDWIADTARGLAVSNNPQAYVTHLRNPDTGAAFYILRQTNSTSNGRITFSLNVTTSSGTLRVPAVIPNATVSGRQSKVMVTDYTFGRASTLTYSTVQIFYAGTLGGRDVLLGFGDSDQEHELMITLAGTPKRARTPTGVTVTPAAGIQGLAGTDVIISFATGIEGLITVWDSDEQLVLYGDTATIATFWSPVIPGALDDPLRNFWQLGTNESILVGGPYLVRSADIADGTLSLRGDLKEDTTLTIIAPQTVQAVTWNGQQVTLDFAATSEVSSFPGTFVAHLKTSASFQTGVQIPKLTNWKYKDSLPEIADGFNDGAWTLANKTKTNIPTKPYYGDGRVLYGCDYGFCENVVLWRGHFNAAGTEKSVNLSINGGEAFAASVWLNDVFLGTSFGNSTNNRNILEETDDKFTFPNGALRIGQDNVITVVQDNMGLNETAGQNTDSSKGPRGVRGFKLNSGSFGDWKVQGKLGDITGAFLDKTRGVFNEGGLFGERKGWHLPGFDASSWEPRDLASGLPDSAAGVGFFVTTFNLDIPSGLDVTLSFTFEEPFGQPYRALLFVNGWMMGKRVGNLGPQSKFPVHEGILDYGGENTVAVALWSMLPDGPVTPQLELTLDGVYDSGVGEIIVDNPQWSPVGREKQ